MAGTGEQASEIHTKEKGVRSDEQIALRKAEKKRRKRERKEKRNAEKASSLDPTPAKQHFETAVASEAGTSRGVHPINRSPATVRNDGMKSARAHYSPSPARVISQPVNTHYAIPGHDDETSGTDEDGMNKSFTATRSIDLVTKLRLESGLPVDEKRVRNPSISPSARSVSEHNSVTRGGHTRDSTTDDTFPDASRDNRKSSTTIQEIFSNGSGDTGYHPVPARNSVRPSKPSKLFWNSDDETIDTFNPTLPSNPVSNTGNDDDDEEHTLLPNLTKWLPPGNSIDPNFGEKHSDIKNREEDSSESLAARHVEMEGTSAELDFVTNVNRKRGYAHLSDSFSDREGSVGETNGVRSLVTKHVEKKRYHRCSDPELDEDSSIEDTIITQGAKAMLSSSSKPLPETHLQAFDLAANSDDSSSSEVEDEVELSDEQEMSDEEQMCDDTPNHRDCESEKTKPVRHIGFPALEDLPKWFPKNIKQIYRKDRHGGALSFKELNEITRYRAALEKIRRQKWKTYLEAGEARWKLQKILRRLRIHPLTKAFCQYRKKQYDVWKDKALKSWKRFEKTHHGISLLDETININVRQEGLIYRNIEKKLGSRL
ncbi:hypothetical protein VTL71DRAFT_3599 [Oculimacula yallundae]|uniref:Uncharacterized protein n=1 Tax=Oculimacula yallundae TaxID=86028 RepID=A0ABR4C9K4_9HELO